LKSILMHGFFPCYSLEDLSWQSSSSDFFIAFPLVSFCDIPLGRISQHVDFYGHYGLGMTKDWGLAKGLNPVLYISQDSPLASCIITAFDGARNMNLDHEEPKYIESMRYIFAHIKPLTGKMFVDDELKNKDFYLENEWRFVPRTNAIKPYLKKSEFDRERDQLNTSAATNACLKFHPNNIRYIFVRNDLEINEIFDFINHNVKECSTNIREILLTRIISIKDMQEDV
jgi:hypothetical protein